MIIKLIRRSAYALLFLGGVIVLGLCFIFYTNTGLQWSLQVASKITQQQLSYSNVKGTLGSEFTVQTLHYQNSNIDINLNNAKITVNPWALIIKSVSIKRFAANSIQVISSNSQPSSTKQSNSSFQLPLTIKLHSLNIKKLNFSNEALQAKMANLTGKLYLIPEDNTSRFLANIIWKNLNLTQHHDSVQLNNSRIIGGGNLNQFYGQFTSAIIFTRGSNPSRQLEAQLVFNGSNKTLHVKSLSLKSSMGTIAGRANIAWQPMLQWDIKIDSADLQKQLPKQKLSASVHFQLTSQGKQTKKGLDGFVTLQHLAGIFNEQAFTGALNLSFSPQKFIFKNTYLTMNNAQFKVTGGLNNHWDLTWSLNTPKLSDLFNIGQGSIISSGKITGSNKYPIITAKLKANHINSFGLSLNSLNTELDVQPKASSHIQISASDIQYRNILINTLFIKALGSLAANQANLMISSPYYNLSTNLQGKIKQQSWNGKITKFTLQQSKLGTWQAPRASGLQFGHNSKTQAFEVKLKQFCLQNQNQRLCTSLEKGAKTFAVQAQLKNLKLSSLLTLLTQEDTGSVITNSLINLTLRYHNGDNPTGVLDGEISPGAIKFIDNGHEQITRITKSNIYAELKNNTLKATTDVQLSQGQNLSAKVAVTHLNQATSKQSIKGRATLNYHDLSLIPKFYPLIKQAHGAIKGQLNFAGTVENPAISGSLRFINGFLSLPSYGLDLKNITFNMDGNKTGRISLRGELNSGGGNLNLLGYFEPMQKGVPAELTLTGLNVLVMNSNAYQFYASPNLKIKKIFHTITVHGTIKVPKARIAPTDFSQGSVSLSQDVQFVHNTQKVSKYLITGDIKLLTGKSIKIDVKGLTGKVKGSVEVFYNSTTDSTATGTLRVEDGEFNAYGQKLTLETGKVIYNLSPLDNPGLDVVAYKTITTQASAANSTLGQSFSIPTSFRQGSKIKVGVNVLGTMKNYKVTLFSQPAMYSQSDILSLILTGETANNISSNSAQLLIKAASSMNLGGNSIGNITQELKQSFGLDELGIANESTYGNGNTTSTTSLVLGKHLTPRLFVSYSIGILDPISIFKASYLLTKNWSLQADASSDDTGLDVFYNIQK